MPAIDQGRARTLIGAFQGRSVLVVGDVMLDHFAIGHVRRISPEAPVPVVQFHHDEYRLGGAANVAHNIQALGGAVQIVGIVGSDEAGDRLALELRSRAIRADGLVTDPSRCTTRKLRVVTHRNQQVARVDFESDEEAGDDVQAGLVDRALRAAETADVILVSDYLKGVVTAELMRRLVIAGGDRQIPVLVDPKIPHIDRYRGSDLVTPNHDEAEIATHLRIRTSAEARDAARAFQQRVGCRSVLITRGEHGMWLLDGSKTAGRGPGAGDRGPGAGSQGAEDQSEAEETALPALAREVADVTGAGDTVIGTIALALAAGARLVEAAMLANYAAGIAVGRFGPATVTPEELIGAIQRTV